MTQNYVPPWTWPWEEMWLLLDKMATAVWCASGNKLLKRDDKLLLRMVCRRSLHIVPTIIFPLWKLIYGVVLSTDISWCWFCRIWGARKCQEERGESPEWWCWWCCPNDGHLCADIGGKNWRGAVRPQPSGPAAEVCALQLWPEASCHRRRRRLRESVGGESCLTEP